MNFDTIIIGGGLSGLVAGISLQKRGQKTLVISSGQSALHFFSGSFEFCNGGTLHSESLKRLPPEHPYSRLGAERVLELEEKVTDFFAGAGIALNGTSGRNHYRITPLGVLKPAWLTLDGYATVPEDGKLPWKTITIANLEGFMDFQPEFIASGLSGLGAECQIRSISLPELDRLRNNPSEMRSANIARALTGNVIGTLARRLSEQAEGSDIILMPAVLGLEDPRASRSLQVRTDVPVRFIATMPPSVPGIRTQMMLKSYYTKTGGTYFLGDSVSGGDFANGRLTGIRSVNHSDKLFRADNFILASGNLFSRGLMTTSGGVFEPVFDLDTDCEQDRTVWASRNFFEAQPYMKFGVACDRKFRASRNGETVENLWVCGAALPGSNAIKEGCGAGVSIITAMDVASQIAES